MSIKLMVFDVAGTTIYDNNDVSRCVVYAFKNFGYDINIEDVDNVMGISKPVAIKEILFKYNGSNFDNYKIEEIHKEYKRHINHYYKYDVDVRPADNAENIFYKLKKRNVKICLDTGFDRETLNIILNRLKWNNNLIDHTVTSDEVENGRPAPDMIYYLMRYFGINDPLSVGKIGDSTSDVQQGLNAGCGLVAAITNKRTSNLRYEFPHVKYISSLEEIIGVLDSFEKENVKN